MATNKITEKKIPVRGVNCAKCRLDIENILGKVTGVEDAKMDYMSGVVSVKYDYTRVDLPEIEKILENLGYNVAYKDYESGLTKLKGLFKKKKSLRKIDDHTFPGLVLETLKPVILLVYKGDCDECERLEAALTKLAVEFKDRVYFYKADCNLSSICSRYNINQTPVILLIQNGVLKQSLPPSALDEEIRKHVIDVLKSTSL